MIFVGKLSAESIISVCLSYTSVNDEADSCCNLSFGSKEFRQWQERQVRWVVPPSTADCFLQSLCPATRAIVVELDSTRYLFFDLQRTRRTHKTGQHQLNNLCKKKRDDTAALVGIFMAYATYRGSLARTFQASSATAWLIYVDHIETWSQHRTMDHMFQISDICATSAQLLPNSRNP